MEIKALLVTLGAGLFFLIGYVLNKITKNKKDFLKFSIALAFMIMIGLICFDLLPEVIENVSEDSLFLRIITFMIPFGLGIVILMLLDKLVPDHHHDHQEGEHNHKEHNSNLYHIGLVTSIALVLHNIIEGGAIYITSLTDIKAGLMIALGVGLHNIPLGMEISGALDLSKSKTSKKIIPLLLITLSTMFGALIMLVLNVTFSPLILTILISITMGMVTYILVFELLKEVMRDIKEKPTILGLIVGLVIVVISLFL